MLEELRIRDLGVITDATLPLGPGLSVVTGETGAGKTMVVTAVGLLLGARSDAAAVLTSVAGQRRWESSPKSVRRWWWSTASRTRSGSRERQPSGEPWTSLP